MILIEYKPNLETMFDGTLPEHKQLRRELTLCRDGTGTYATRGVPEGKTTLKKHCKGWRVRGKSPESGQKRGAYTEAGTFKNCPESFCLQSQGQLRMETQVSKSGVAGVAMVPS